MPYAYSLTAYLVMPETFSYPDIMSYYHRCSIDSRAHIVCGNMGIQYSLLVLPPWSTWPPWLGLWPLLLICPIKTNTFDVYGCCPLSKCSGVCNRVLSSSGFWFLPWPLQAPDYQFVVMREPFRSGSLPRWPLTVNVLLVLWHGWTCIMYV